MVSSPVAEVEAEEHQQSSIVADTTTIPSHSEPQQDDHKPQDIQNQDPNPTELPSPHFETLDPPNPNQSDDKQVIDNNTLTIVTEDHLPQLPPPQRMTSPRPRQNSKRKKGNIHKRKHLMKKMNSLSEILNPKPYRPTIALDFVKHEDVLKRLGLYEFSKIEFDRTIRKDYLVQLIVNYDSKKRCSFVNDYRVNLNRTDLARALKLPVQKMDKGTNKVDEVDLDSEEFSDDAIRFIEDFVMNWMLLPEMRLVTPSEIANWTRCIRDGHPEKLDLASLIWYNVERELAQGDKLTDCYFASHLQYLIKACRPELFVDDDGDVDADECEEITKLDDGVDNDCEEIAKIDDEKADKDEKEEKYDEEPKEEKDDEEEKVQKQEKDDNLGKVSIVEEHDIELTLGPDVEESVHEEVNKDDEMMVNADEFKAVDEEHGNLGLGGKNILGDPYLQRCQNRDLNSYEERQFQQVDDEQMEQVEDEDGEEEEQEEGERVDEGFDMEANDSIDRDGLADNYLQGMETSHIQYNNSHGMSLFGSRDEMVMSHGGPSFFNNGGKRVMEEEDVHHLDGNNKRLKTNEMWDHKSSDLGYCFEQMHQWMEKAKMVHDSKEQSFANTQYSHQYELNQMQERENILEGILKSKDEELQKKNTEVFRLERELYLMVDLVKGYRKMLNDTRFKFSEYRKRYVVQEEPLYKDAGPGGLVLSTRELEKQRLKQEEDKMKYMMMAKNLEDEFVCVFKLHDDKVLMLGDKLMSIENEVKRLRESNSQRKETQMGQDEHESLVEPKENQKSTGQRLSSEPEGNQKSVDEHELTAELEDNQMLVDDDVSTAELEDNQKSFDEQESTAELEENKKSLDEVPVNDATVKHDADESKEKVDGED
ncbi:uncharacterized protein [Rutidosis leptorrhynchoides]|uniref:uncharacterized protein n=1 Tax=Rutidosis leptorrhynchoides TaxID=125765 RepID=UPI003A99629A